LTTSARIITSRLHPARRRAAYSSGSITPVKGVPLEAVLKRDRLVVLGGVILLAGLGWAYLVMMAAGMDLEPTGESARALAAPRLEAWSPGYFAMMLSMWTVMMVAMMLPSAAPLLLVYARIARQNREQGQPIAPTGAFAAGYLLAWTAFSVAATLLQWGLERAALLSPMMVASTPYLGALLLIGAGVYQLTPLKRACLAHCRSPLAFLMHHWRTGLGGAIRMGLEHGAYCIGCCWFLMALLFVGGVMNLLWIAAISIFVLLEKVAPRGEMVAIAAGAVLVAAGVWTALAA
jgi:predicted metal-binding membrane protein